MRVDMATDFPVPPETTRATWLDGIAARTARPEESP